MLLRFAPLLLLLAFAPAHANCGFAMSGEGMTIVVGRGPCGAEFRQAFAAEIRAAMEAEAAPGRRAFDERTPNAARLWALEEQRFQATQPGGRYFGQR